MTGPAGRTVRGAGILSAAIALALLAPERRASAHAVGLSSGEYRLDGRVLFGEIGMADSGARPLAAGDRYEPRRVRRRGGADRGARRRRPGTPFRGDRIGRRPRLSRLAHWALVLEGDGGAVFQTRYTCPAIPVRLTMTAAMLAALAPQHRHMARVFRAGIAQSQVLDRAHAVWTLDRTGPPGSAVRAGWSTAWAMVKLGVGHILGGADHLVFLLGLILVGGTLRSLAGVVTAFTVAHSITLAIAALAIFAPSPRFVEPAIALSIAYVGVENFFVKDGAVAGESRSRSASSTGSALRGRCARSRCRAPRCRSRWSRSTSASRRVSSPFSPSLSP